MNCKFCGDDEDTITPCKCGYQAHSKCLAQYQFVHAGKPSERRCPKCSTPYPHWQDNIMSRQYEMEDMAILEVKYKGKLAKIIAMNGAEGQDAFCKQIKRIFKFEKQPELSMKCKIPGTNKTHQFRGWEAFDVAIFCAAVAQKKGTNLIEEILVV